MPDFRSTFPLDEAAITRRTLGRVLTDPITWVPLVPAVAAYAIFDVPAFFALGLGAAVLGGVGAFWRKQWTGMTEKLRRKTIEDHNRAQDATLKAAADELRLAGAAPWAQKLEQFLAIKTKVEARLHEDGEITPQKIQLEQLIDSLCFGVRDQLSALAAREKASGEAPDRREILSQVQAAYDTLQAAVGELDLILGPKHLAGGDAHATLEELTQRLREETEIARRVQARLRAAEDTPAALSEAPQKESE